MNTTTATAQDPFSGITPASQQEIICSLQAPLFLRHRDIIEAIAEGEGARDQRSPEGWGERVEEGFGGIKAVQSEGYGG